MPPTRKPPDWLIEERRQTLGDHAAFCVSCGHVLRYFEQFASEVPSACPQCGGDLLARCPVCDARFASAFTVACNECGTQVRDPELFGTRIRR